MSGFSELDKRFHLVNFRYSDLWSIQDTYEDIPTFYNDIGDIGAVAPVCDKMNELNYECESLEQRLNQCKTDCAKLITENLLLKQALCEQLEENGNSYYIDLFDEIFGLKYNMWNSLSDKYVDWEMYKKEYKSLEGKI